MTLVQTSYSQSPTAAVIGQFADIAPRGVESKAARGRIKAGYGVFKGNATTAGAGTSMLDAGEVYQNPDPIVAADVDAIVTAYTTSTAVQTFSGTGLNGLVGAAEMQPPRFLTMVCSSHADFDATDLSITGVNHLGQTVTELLAIANGGNSTITSLTLWRSITLLSVPAQSGTGGTATFGVSALVTLVIADFRGVAVRQPVKTTVSTLGLYGMPGITSVTVTADYVDGEVVPVLYDGSIWVYSEEAIADGDPVYVRVSGTGTIGAFRNDSDSSSCALVVGATFCRDSTAAGPAWCRFR